MLTWFLIGSAAALAGVLPLVVSRRSLARKPTALAAGTPVLHREQRASGYSHRNLLTQLGGVARAVELTVTNDQLLVDVASPLTFVAARLDLCHRIARHSIERVAARRMPQGLECIITFRNAAGLPQRLSLFPESPERFLHALQVPAPELA